jgi:hypothetical protein
MVFAAPLLRVQMKLFSLLPKEVAVFFLKTLKIIDKEKQKLFTLFVGVLNPITR